MVTIRLSRKGATRNPYYHIVVIDSRKKDSGRPLERVGFFNPSATGQEVSLKLEQDRIDHWVSQGAQISDRVSKLIKENTAAATAA
jgi:small subunit ribosomal protein S16